MATRMHLDFETFSLLDLRQVGAHVYAEHPSTLITCMSWCFDEGGVRSWRFGEPLPQEVAQHVADGGEVHAWNAAFEFAIWNAVLVALGFPPLPLAQVWCTMAQGAVWGLPLALGDAGPAVGALIVKDKSAHLLMLSMARPRRSRNGGPLRRWHEDDPARLDKLVSYNARDVGAERDIWRKLPAMPPRERQIWLLDQKMNNRGVRVDLDLIDALIRLSTAEVARLDQLTHQTTGGKVTSTRSVAAMLAWLNQQPGFAAQPVQSLKADALPLALRHAPKGSPERIVLLARKQAARASVAKLAKMESTAGAIQRIRGLTQYYGANRTGRWSGRIVQVQNLPRPLKGLDIPMIARHVLNGADAETLRVIHGEPMTVIAALIRACLCARDGRKLVLADFSQIEARVVAWLADQRDALKVFASGQDIYVYTANAIGSPIRQLGKVLVLACGFGMGWRKFIETAAKYGIQLDEEQARTAVYGWRRANHKIVELWHATGAKAIEVVRDGLLSWQPVGKLAFKMGSGLMRGHLLMRLPSDRVLVYRDPLIEQDRFGDCLTYMGTHQTTKQWTRLRTYGGKLIENATQAFARDLLADAMLDMDALGFELLTSIHDEVVAEDDDDTADVTLAHMLSIMSRPPLYAAGLPLDAAGLVNRRYGKG